MHGWLSVAGFLTTWDFGLQARLFHPVYDQRMSLPGEGRCIVPRPVPDVACETAIIREFLSYSFHVVDQTQVKFLRMTDVSSSPRLW